MHNRIAIITGASSGLGKAMALRFAEKKVRMVLNGRDEAKLTHAGRLVNSIGKGEISRIVCGDISDPQTTDRCIVTCKNAWNELPSIFIASAGRGLSGTVINSDAGQWGDLINTN